MDDNSTESMRLREKLYAIMSDIERIEKDKRNNEQHYDYASEKAIKEELHAAFVRHRVLYNCEPVKLLWQGLTPKGTQMAVIIKFRVEFEDVDTGETKVGYALGAGVDSGDKAVYKAQTGAIKYSLTTRFLIPTGDDPEASNQTSEFGATTNTNLRPIQQQQPANPMMAAAAKSGSVGAPQQPSPAQSSSVAVRDIGAEVARLGVAVSKAQNRDELLALWDAEQPALSKLHTTSQEAFAKVDAQFKSRAEAFKNAA